MFEYLKLFIRRAFGEYKTRRNECQVNCPKCAALNNYIPDNKFNLEINIKKGIFNCWKCNYKGGLKHLIKKYGSRDEYNFFKETKLYEIPKEFLKNNSEEYDDLFEPEIDKKLELPEEFISFKDVNLNNWQHAKAYDFLIKDRGISEEIIDKYELGFALKGRYYQRIIIPSYDKNNELNFFDTRTYTDSSLKYLKPYVNKNEIIFNEKHIDFASMLVIVEGPFDYLTIPFNTVTLLGKKMTQNIYEKIYEHKPNIIIALDGDALNDSMKIFENLIFSGFENKVKIAKFEDSYDIDSFKKMNGKDKLIELLHSSISMDEFQEMKTMRMFQ